MINYVDVAEASAVNNYEYAILPFYMNSKPFTDRGAARWGMSLLAAGSMRFRWDETNSNRDAFLQKLSTLNSQFSINKVVSLELIHSKIVFDLKSGDETFQKQGDGMITQNRNFIPVVTVADCMPLYLYDPETQVFGVVHSGWKGTGIIGEAIKLAAQNYGAKAKNILIVIGAHIHDCCYIVDEERAKYFADNFGAACVKKCDAFDDGAEFANVKGFEAAASNSENYSMPLGIEKNETGRGGDIVQYRLSLEKANLAVLEKSGILEENIVVAKNCTCCDERFGSFRRQAAFTNIEDKSKAFTVQAAFVLGA